MKLFKNKKGNWVDVFDYLGTALGLGIVILIVGTLLFSFNAALQSNPSVNSSTTAMTQASSISTKFPTASDFILPLIYIFVLGFTAWSASKIESSHKFAFIGVFVLVVLVLMSLIIESGWDLFTDNATIAARIASYPITNFMLFNMRYFVLFFGLVTGVALYAKTE